MSEEVGTAMAGRIISARSAHTTRWWMTRFLLLALLLGGCSPENQAAGFLDPDSGLPVLRVALCDGEKVDAFGLSARGDPDGYPDLWRVERNPDAVGVDKAVLGQTPAGYTEVVALDQSYVPRNVDFVAELSGGAASQAVAVIRTVDDLPDVDSPPTPAAGPKRSDELPGTDRWTPVMGLQRNAAEDNCSLIPSHLPASMSMLALAIFAVMIAAGIYVYSKGHIEPRGAARSPWRVVLGFAFVAAFVIFAPWEMETRDEPMHFLGVGAALGSILVITSMLGRGLRSLGGAIAGFVEPMLVVVVGCLAVVPMMLYFGVTEGGFSHCGEGWTFDCSPSYLDRVMLMVPLGVAWLTSVLVGEGGWWRASGSLEGPGSTGAAILPRKRVVALALMCGVSLVANALYEGDSAEREPNLVAGAVSCALPLLEPLVEAGVDPNLRGFGAEGATPDYPLAAASEYCDPEVIDLLLTAGASIDLPPSSPPLARAVERSNSDAARRLIQAGADPTWEYGNGRNLVWTAVERDDAELVTVLAESGAMVDQEDPDLGQAPLFRSVMFGRSASFDALLANGADPNTRGDLTWGHLQQFLNSVGEDRQRALLGELGQAIGLDQAALDKFIPGDMFQTYANLTLDGSLDEVAGSFPALYVAVAVGDAEMVRSLLAAGADPTEGAGPNGHLPAEAAEILGMEQVEWPVSPGE